MNGYTFLRDCLTSHELTETIYSIVNLNVLFVVNQLYIVAIGSEFQLFHRSVVNEYQRATTSEVVISWGFQVSDQCYEISLCMFVAELIPEIP